MVLNKKKDVISNPELALAVVKLDGTYLAYVDD